MTPHSTDTHDDARARPERRPRPPTPLSRKLVRYIVGFGVGVGVGLAPYLGLLDVWGFKALLTLIPDAIQSTAIPLSAAMMGTIAVVVQWYGGERLTRKRLGKWFARTLATAAASFVLLTIVHSLVVATVPMKGGRLASFVVGFTKPPDKPPCLPDDSDAQCIKRLTFDPAIIESYWGGGRIRLARLSLIFSYLLFTGSFGALVGLVVLRERK